MSFEPEKWTRLEHDRTPIYVDAETPNWFVPNTAGDQLLRNLPRGASVRRSPFLQRLPGSAAADYVGRAQSLSLETLRELWFHVTDRCNLACTHCLFASGSNRCEELRIEEIRRHAAQASRLGCRVFALTGGEPFVHRQFVTMVDELLALPEATVVVLTNGTLLKRHESRLRNWRGSNFHLQVSVDGLPPAHDAIRGAGSHATLVQQLQVLQELSMAYTVSVCVTRENVADLPEIVDFCADVGAANLHLMWYFVRGRGDAQQWVDPDEILPHLFRAMERAERHGISIDNIEALKTQAFAPSGTRHDGSGAGWESLAIGTDGNVYPSPASIGVPELSCPIRGDLEAAWRNSPPLQRIRAATAVSLESPLRFLTGGGDSDHSFMHSGEFLGRDPYLPLYEKLLLHLISSQAADGDENDPAALRLKMGDILETCGAHGEVALTHSNCLLAVAAVDGRTAVKDFYARAAETPKEDIRNPVHYAAELISHIPEESRVRSYGCGSPVLDADLEKGEYVVDLGSGSGVECFIASRVVGARGKVIGVDMLDAMLELSQTGAVGVADNLGYRNLEFRKGYLEQLPLQDGVADVVISNCVMNLSTHKRRLFSEVFRVLKPGGRLLVSDVVCETDPPASIRNDARLRGECIGGALAERDLFGLLAESGLGAARVLKRFPYRTVDGHPFYSLTFRAVKPSRTDTARAIYRGPLSGVTLRDGTYVAAGVVSEVPTAEIAGLDGEFFRLDEAGNVINVDLGQSCCRGAAPEDETPPSQEGSCCAPSGRPAAVKMRSGCMVCGSRLRYLDTREDHDCGFCGENQAAEAVCANGHFVCDTCHARDALAVMEHICRTTSETDMIGLMQTIRSHPAISVHGPEHHALVPGIILATYRNLGGGLNDEQIRSGMLRGSKVPGGGCGLLGICGAASGVGTAVAVIMESNPLRGTQRQLAQLATQRALSAISQLDAPRCCQRDLWLALRSAEAFSAEMLPIALRARVPLRCTQASENPECIGARCPVIEAWKTGDRKLSKTTQLI
ncbi:MAG: DUF5714 domain-containing protein [Planctomycetota bacterium]